MTDLPTAFGTSLERAICASTELLLALETKGKPKAEPMAAVAFKNERRSKRFFMKWGGV